jgi:hypothetical protein
MIARFNIFLPFALAMRPSDQLAPFQTECGGYPVTVHPPCLAELTQAEMSVDPPLPFGEIVRRLQPATHQRVSGVVLLDDTPAIQANLLVLDFHKAAFDRRIITDYEQQLTGGDPPLVLAITVANSLLTRIRTLARGHQVQALDPRQALWRADYLTDGGELLPRAPGHHRRRFGSRGRHAVTALTKDLWGQAQALPADFAPWAWDTLLLDAEALLPDVDSAIALVNASLEAFSRWLLDQAASRASLPEGLWGWMNKRDHWMQEPSVNDRFGPLLKALTGHSLTEEAPLWEAYKQLREARNTFSHRGKPTIGGKRPREVTAEMAEDLIEAAKKLVDWCEALLPKECRRETAPGGVQIAWLLPVGELPTIPEPSQGQGVTEKGGPEGPQAPPSAPPKE